LRSGAFLIAVGDSEPATGAACQADIGLSQIYEKAGKLQAYCE
jgi:hypothetical protein